MTGYDPRDGEMASAPAAEPAVLRAGQPDVVPIWSQSTIAPPDFAGKRISLKMWALAALVGASIWAVIFKLLL
jgi:hypothetical protein